MTDTADVVIVGGGIEGAAAAWALAQRGVTDVVVVERNTVGSGMTGKSSGIVRCHYGVSSLAAMATIGLEVFEKAEEIFGTDIGFRQTGYVVGVGEPNVDALRKSLAAQRAVGVQTEEIDTPRWRACGRSPTCRRSRRSAGRPAAVTATPTRPRRRSRCRPGPPGSGSARAPTVTDLLLDGDRVTGVRLADGTEISAGTVVVATGVWTRPFLAPYGIDVPIRVVREQIVLISPGVDIGPVPVFSDLVSLQYIRPEVGGRHAVRQQRPVATSRRPTPTTTSTGPPRRSSTSPSTRSAPGSPASPTRRSPAATPAATTSPRTGTR